MKRCLICNNYGCRGDCQFMKNAPVAPMNGVVTWRGAFTFLAGLIVGVLIVVNGMGKLVDEQDSTIAKLKVELPKQENVTLYCFNGATWDRCRNYKGQFFDAALKPAKAIKNLGIDCHITLSTATSANTPTVQTHYQVAP